MGILGGLHFCYGDVSLNHKIFMTKQSVWFYVQTRNVQVVSAGICESRWQISTYFVRTV